MWWLLWLAMAAAPTPEQAAREAFELAAESRVGEARARLREAYEQTNDPALLYVRGAFERDQGNCPLAIHYFESFVAAGPAPEDAARAQAEIDTCRELIASEQATAEPAPAPRPDAPATTTPSPHARRPLAGPVVFGVGAAVASAGAGLWIGSAVERRRAADAPTEGAYDERLQRPRALHVAGVSLVSVGAATAVAGAIVWALQWRETPARKRRASVRATWGGLTCAF